MTAAKFTLLTTAAILALGVASVPARAATTGEMLNTPVDVGGPPESAQQAPEAPAPTTGEMLNTPVDIGQPPDEMKSAANEAAQSAPTTGEMLNTPVDKAGSTGP